jgi:hypothetical protein
VLFNNSAFGNAWVELEAVLGARDRVPPALKRLGTSALKGALHSHLELLRRDSA